jgi:peptidoglycan glycosyltransferase
VNKQIIRLSIGALILMTSLIVATTYWQTWAAAGLAERQDNSIQRVAQFKIKRGLIYARDGRTVLAASRHRRVGGNTLWFRAYPQHQLAAHVVGYSTVARSRAGLERSENDYLTASNSDLNTTIDTTLDKLKGATIVGNNVVTTIDVHAQQVAESLLRGECGAAVVIDVETGAILALASSPGYDPNQIERNYARTQRAAGSPCKPPAPLLDRATQGLYPPGSTFKVITAAAALDTGAFRPDSTFVDPGYCEEYGRRISNAGNPEAPETFGRLALSTALQHSVNSVFCNIGKQMGAKVILEYAKRFGFYSSPPLETPPSERYPSGLYDRATHKLWDPKDPATQVDPGRLAFGQERMLVTPLQMAMVAATIANKGVVVKPRLVKRITSPDGKTIASSGREELGRAIKPETAAALTEMMVSVVEGGTGTAAQIPGMRVAGKTGTAETGRKDVYIPWFIAFAPADDPKVAVAVVVEDKARGFGGTVSAPIAKALMQAILERR